MNRAVWRYGRGGKRWHYVHTLGFKRCACNGGGGPPLLLSFILSLDSISSRSIYST